jgi:Fic family protein
VREFTYRNRPENLLTPPIVNLLTTIHEFKGKEYYLTEGKSDILNHLREIAKIQSTASSNAIEGIYTSDERLKKLVLDKTNPKNRDEKEIAGYRDVLNTIHENYEHIPVRPTFILQMHRDLYRYEGNDVGGHFKTSDNVIQETDANGHTRVRFKPLPAWAVEDAMDRLCQAYAEGLATPDAEPLLLIPMFILDFLCIHPFMDGNGRMSRLLTLLLLYQNGYSIGRYVSLEHLIEKTKNSYYDTLQASSQGWHEGTNTYLPFVKYYLGVIVAAYRDFMDRAEAVIEISPSKPDRVAKAIQQHLGAVSKAELIKLLPDISDITIQRTLAELVKEGKIEKIGKARNTKYVWKGMD